MKDIFTRMNELAMYVGKLDPEIAVISFGDRGPGFGNNNMLIFYFEGSYYEQRVPKTLSVQEFFNKYADIIKKNETHYNTIMSFILGKEGVA